MGARDAIMSKKEVKNFDTDEKLKLKLMESLVDHEAKVVGRGRDENER